MHQFTFGDPAEPELLEKPGRESQCNHLSGMQGADAFNCRSNQRAAYAVPVAIAFDSK